MRMITAMKNTAMSLIIAAGILFYSGSVSGGDSPESVHPELSQEEFLVPCSSCHQENTPDIYQQWYDSVHGVAMVKCYQCHGTFETFKVTPSVQDCETCHVVMATEDHSKNKICWECHAPHLFKPSK